MLLLLFALLLRSNESGSRGEAAGEPLPLVSLGDDALVGESGLVLGLLVVHWMMMMMMVKEGRERGRQCVEDPLVHWPWG